MTTWCANRLSNRLSKGLRGFMGGPEGGAVCRPQPVNRRFRVSRYLARKSDPLCRHNVCYQSTYVCYPAVDSALDGQGVYESVLHSVACGTVFHMCYHTTAAVGRVCAGAGRRTVATSCSCHMAPNLTTLRLRHDIAISSAQSIPTAFHSNNGRHVCNMYGMEYRLNSKQRGHRRQGLMLLSNPTEH